MYAEFFGFTELPFNNTPDPRFFYSTPDHEEALASLIYAVKEWKGFVLLTGEIGAGKTLVSRMMLRHFGTHIAFASINHAVQESTDLLESICEEFELPIKEGMSATQLVRTLHDYLLVQFAQNIPVVLVLDEAQNLPVGGFEQLRMIGNLEADDAKLLQIVIVGQPELQQMFLSPKLRQLRQRIFRSFHLPAMSREAAEEYIHHRLSVVSDSDEEIFSHGALSVIAEYSRGLPRLINTACDNALLSAYSAERRKIDKPFMESVIAQMMTLAEPIDEPAGVLPRGMGSRPSLSEYRPAVGLGEVEERPLRNEGVRALSLVTTLAHRIDEVEARLLQRPVAIQQQVPAAPAPAPAPAPRVEDNRGDAAVLQRGVYANLEKVARRVGDLERWCLSARDDSSDARRAEANLKPMVERARSLVGRAESASRDLQRREQQLRQLSVTVKTVVRDMKNMLEHSRKTTKERSRAQRDAEAIYERLVKQTENSRQLADEFTFDLPSRSTSDFLKAGERMSDDKEGSTSSLASIRKSLLDVRRSSVGGVERVGKNRGTRRVQEMLKNSATSLTDLRELARDDSGARPTVSVERKNLSVARLASQVEELLEMVESPSPVPVS